MRTTVHLAFHVLAFTPIAWLIPVSAADEGAPSSTNSILYGYRREHDPNGIGKFYLGREIAHVMGHQAAAWLERADRDETELPQRVVEEMKLAPSDVVADVGAGTGYFSFRLARAVPQGSVYAVDIQPEMLAIIEQRKTQQKVTNVVSVLGTESNTKLPAASVDVALLVDAYHEFAFPREMMDSIVRSLKPGGRVVLIEYRAEDPTVPIKAVHKMTVDQAKKELTAAGLKFKETKEFLPLQHFIVFERR